ncbi:MAG: sulfatase-like hydrolase/transferase [Planctomycetes bacterium]|nr:sulfatase-like hydrolase/transferase [Planctomycetota bacterium]
MSRSITTLAGLSFKAFAFLAVLVDMVGRIRATGAIPGDEFHAAGVLYGALPALRSSSFILAALTLAVIALAWQASRRRAESGWAWVVIGSSVVASFWVAVPALALGLLVYELDWAKGYLRSATSLAGEPALALDEAGELLTGLSPREILGWWPGLAALASLAALFVTGIESFIYTADFSPELFPEAVLGKYRFRLLDLCTAFGCGIGVAYLVPALVAWPCLRLLRRAPGLPRLAPVVVAVAMALGATVYTRIGLMRVLGDEIRAVDVLGHSDFYSAMVFFFWMHASLRNLLDAGARRPDGAPRRAGEVFCHAALGLLGLAPRHLPDAIRRRPGWQFLIHAAVASLWLAALVHLAFPELEDFRSKLIALGVITAVHVLVLLLIALAFALRAGRPLIEPGAKAWGLGVVVFLIGLSSLRPLGGEVALVVHEYSRFGYIVKLGSVRSVLRPANRLGYEKSGFAFEVHGPGDDRYPVDPPASLTGKRPPIVIVLWDAARPDRMSGMGYHRDTTPLTDQLLRESVVFSHAYSGATATTCGVRHLFTGRYSTRYMLEENHDPFFVHDLRRHGYDRFYLTAFGTDYNGVSLEAFFRGGPPIQSDGADFQNLTRHPQGLDRERPDTEKQAKMIAAWKQAFAERGDGCLDGSFSFLHLTGTHFPWYNENPVRDYGKSWSDLYDAEMAKCDVLTGEAFDVLRDIGAWDDAIIVFLADHGTGLMEHGRWAGFLPYEEQIRVPLVIKVPGVAPRQVDQAVSLIDLAPTLVGLFEPGAENPFDGVSLYDLMTGRRTKLGREYLASLCAFEDAYTLLQDGRWKLHYHRAANYSLLFDLENDPAERVNLIERDPERHRALVEQMGAFLWRGRRGYANPYHYREWQPPQK